jgi:hypothetical protein
VTHPAASGVAIDDPGSGRLDSARGLIRGSLRAAREWA